MVLKYTNGHKTYQHFPLQDPPKLTQIGTLGLKIYHLATLHGIASKLFHGGNGGKKRQKAVFVWIVGNARRHKMFALIVSIFYFV
jgi:hypothetical protein